MKTRNNNFSLRRGMTSVLAMLYLVLFGTLAIGFYAATNTQSQIVSNDERVAKAFMACESGMDFMRYQLGRVYIPPEPLPANEVVAALYANLQEQLDGTGNLGGQSIELIDNIIRIPADGGYINLDSNGHSRFRATITDWAGEIVVKIDGTNGTMQAARAITMDFTRVEHSATAFDHAVASKGQIRVKKGEFTSVSGVDPSIVTMMSSLPISDAITVSSPSVIGGDLSVVKNGDVVVTGGTVGGSSIVSVILSDHVNRDVDPPNFPVIDTTVFAPYATNTYVHSGSNVVMSNVVVPPNTGTAQNPLKFTGNRTVQGILYIQSPNHVQFQGNVNLQGFIVFENAGDSSDNSLKFSGNVTQSPLPAAPEFDPLRATSGLAILAPTSRVYMTGNSDSVLRGSLIAARLHIEGSNNILIDQGTLMTYDEVSDSTLLENKSIRFTGTGSGNMPTIGLSYETYYEPKPSTYQEVAP